MQFVPELGQTLGFVGADSKADTKVQGQNALPALPHLNAGVTRFSATCQQAAVLQLLCTKRLLVLQDLVSCCVVGQVL